MAKIVWTPWTAGVGEDEESFSCREADRGKSKPSRHEWKGTVVIHASLVCQGCSGTLYAVSTQGGAASLPTWKVDHDHTPATCPVRPLLPLKGTAAHIQELPGAVHVLTQPA